MSLFGVLFLIFLVLKLVGIIAWSWWWVTAPLWLGWGTILLVWGVIVLVWRVQEWEEKRNEWPGMPR